MFKVLTIFGTRPEAIKLAPILIELKKFPKIRSQICVTAQHRQMLDQVLSIFDIIPNIDLDLMCQNQLLPDLTAKVITEIDCILTKLSPDLVLVQGDTTTTMASAMAAFYNKIPVGHVEAGLRSGDIHSPFPEEMNRQIAGLAARYHFAPTSAAEQALLKEGVPKDRVFLTGNPVIDALEIVLRKPIPPLVKSLLRRIGLNGKANRRNLILVTAHRREHFGKGMENICYGLKTLATRNKDIRILYPVHFNPNVREPVFRTLDNVKNIFLIDPVGYDVMAHLMNVAHLILTDSGGIQEEAPALGKPVLVMRTETERHEGIEAGTAKLVRPEADCIVAETEHLLTDEDAYRRMARSVNPYGDGQAAKRIVRIISSIANSTAPLAYGKRDTSIEIRSTKPEIRNNIEIQKH